MKTILSISKKVKWITLTFPFVLSLFPSQAQEIDPSKITIDRLVDNSLSAKSFGPVYWLEGKSAYARLEEDKDYYKGRREIVSYDVKTGERNVIIPAWRLIPPGYSTPIHVHHYSFTNNLSHALIYTNSVSRIFGGSKGDYWVLDLLLWDWHKVGKDMPGQSVQHAQFSPNGKMVSFVFENNIYVDDLRSHNVYKLTNDGSEKIFNGLPLSWRNWNSAVIGHTSGGPRKSNAGHSWSPDSKSIAFVQTDMRVVPDFYMINNTETQYPEIIETPYVKIGNPLADLKVGIIDVNQKELKWLDIPDESFTYLWQMEWKPNLDHLILQTVDRSQKRIYFYLATVDGKVKKIHEDYDQWWIEPSNIHWVSNETKFIHTSEKDGWVHLYLKSEKDNTDPILTPGDYDMIYVYGVDEKNGWIYIMASPGNPTQRYLYRVSMDGKGTMQKLTPPNFQGTNRYQFSPDLNFAIHTYSSMETPPEYRLVSLPDHKEVRILEDNGELKEALARMDRVPTEFYKVDIGNGVKLDGYCIKPPDMDETKKYPLFYYIYGEPAGQTVLDRWGGIRYFWHLMLAQKGYVVMSIDPRGTPSPQGSPWRKVIYGQLGWLAAQEHALATQEIPKQFPYIDSERVGIWGHSGGGQMSLNCIFRYPELYHVAMPSSFVSHQKIYHPAYQERFMGQYEDNVEGYTKGSPITWAHNLKGKLLIIHGTGDSNVIYQSFESMVNELIAHKKEFSMMSYPNREHGLREGINTQYHLYTLRTNYLLNNLPPGPR
jgi:dipeptidyl-peptidase-4